jgi:hypothetical protein
VIESQLNRRYDSDGPFYDCSWYVENEYFCGSLAERYANFGMDANAACCHCGGGISACTGGGASVATEDWVLFSPFDNSVGTTAMLTPSTSIASAEFSSTAIDTTVGDALAGAGQAAAAIGTILAGTATLAVAGGAIAAVGPVLSIASMCFGLAGVNTDTSTAPGFEFMNQKFDEVNIKLDSLQNQITEGINGVLAQTVRSEVSTKTNRLRFLLDAHKDFTTSRNHGARSGQYEPNFRTACNNNIDLHPSNIFWWLYGHVCKNCNVGDGVKQYGYYLDIMKTEADFKTSKFHEFQKVMQEALIEAMYLHTVCLPPSARHHDRSHERHRLER